MVNSDPPASAIDRPIGLSRLFPAHKKCSTYVLMFERYISRASRFIRYHHFSNGEKTTTTKMNAFAAAAAALLFLFAASAAGK